MNPTSGAESFDDDVDFEIAEECRAALDHGTTVDPQALATKYAVDPARVRRILLAVEAVRGGSTAFFATASAYDSPRSELAPPTLPADYELGPMIGKGGMGVVYRARQKSLGRDVAVKVLRPGEILFGDAIRRFRREAASLARLRHPHIVAIHDLGEANGQVFFAMDLIDGKPLSELLATKRPMAPSAAVRLLRQTTSAIAYAHERGVIHRDLKPSNILVSKENDAYVVDFGLAVDVRHDGDPTVSGRILGTPAYMAPEQARGETKRIGERTDVYALGVLLYEMLAGKAPFAAPSLAETLAKILNEEPEPLGRVNAVVPAALAAIVHHAMAKDPEKRYPTAKALLDDLDRFVEGREVRAKPEGPLARLWRGVVRRSDMAFVALLTSLVVGGFVLWRTRPDPLERWSEALEVVESFAAAGKTQTAIDHLERSIDLAPGFLARDKALERLFELRFHRLGEAARIGDEAAVKNLAATIVRDADEALGGLNSADGDFESRRRDLGLKRIFARAAAASADELIADSDAFIAMSQDHEAPLILVLLDAAEAYGVDGPRTYGRGVVRTLARRFSVESVDRSESVEAWFVEKPDSRVSVLAAIVRDIADNASAPGVRLGRCLEAARALAGTSARRPLVLGLLEIAEAEIDRHSLGEPSELAVVALLADIVDAPFRVREFKDVLSSTPDDAENLRALEAGAKAVGGERHRLFADRAAALLTSRDDRAFADRWLTRRGADAEVRESNPHWLESFRLDDRPFLERSLGLSDDVGAATEGSLVTRLAVSSESDRARIHELLTRIVARPERAPFWSSRSGCPADLVEQWWAAVGRVAVGDFVLRVALVHRDQNGTLQVVRSLTEQARLFTPVKLDWHLDYVPQCDGRLVRPFARAVTRVGPYGPAFPVAFEFDATLALKGLGPRIVFSVNGREALTFEVEPGAGTFALQHHDPQFAGLRQKQLQQFLAPRRNDRSSRSSRAPSSDLNDYFFRREYVFLAAVEPRGEAPLRPWTLEDWRTWSAANGLGVEPIDDLTRPAYWKRTISDRAVLASIAAMILALLIGGRLSARRRSKLLSAVLSSASLAAGSVVLCLRFPETWIAASAGALGSIAIAAAFAVFPGVRARRFDRLCAVFLVIAGAAQTGAALFGPHSGAERAAGVLLASLVLLRSGQLFVAFRALLPSSRLFAASMCLLSLVWGLELALSAVGEDFGWWSADTRSRWVSSLAFWLLEDLIGVFAVSVSPNVGDRFPDVDAYLAGRRMKLGGGAPASKPVSESIR